MQGKRKWCGWQQVDNRIQENAKWFWFIVYVFLAESAVCGSRGKLQCVVADVSCSILVDNRSFEGRGCIVSWQRQIVVFFCTCNLQCSGWQSMLWEHAHSGTFDREQGSLLSAVNLEHHPIHFLSIKAALYYATLSQHFRGNDISLDLDLLNDYSPF